MRFAEHNDSESADGSLDLHATSDCGFGPPMGVLPRDFSSRPAIRDRERDRGGTSGILNVTVGA